MTDLTKLDPRYWPPHLRDHYFERAGVKQFDANMTPEQAEAEAMAETIKLQREETGK